MAACLLIIDLRAACVGCAVNTSSVFWRSRFSRMDSGLKPFAIRSLKQSWMVKELPFIERSPRLYSRQRRTRWLRSTRFACCSISRKSRAEVLMCSACIITTLLCIALKFFSVGSCSYSSET